MLSKNCKKHKHSTKTVPKNNCSKKIGKISRKTLVTESFFSLKTASSEIFLKKGHSDCCSPGKAAKAFGTDILQNTYKQQLLQK